MKRLTCPACAGSGLADGERCADCDGWGYPARRAIVTPAVLRILRQDAARLVGDCRPLWERALELRVVTSARLPHVTPHGVPFELR